MGADDVAVLWARHGADDGATFARAGRPPMDRELEFAPRCRMGRDPDMVNPVGTSHCHLSFGRKYTTALNGDGPPKQTGLITNHEN